ncbi:MAG: thymidine phosphorylase family protein [Gammaproteobacteria bacterium]
MNEQQQKPQPLGTLALRQVAIDTYRENVAYMHRECEVYRAEGFQALSKIKVLANGQQIFAVLNVVDDDSIVAPGQLGLSEQAFEQLGLKASQNVRVAHAEPPPSMDAVRRKINGERLSFADFEKHCIGGIPGNRTTMLIVPIVAAHGTLMPKTSSRAITSPAGTADTMEILANVEVKPEVMYDIVAKQRACIAWGGTANLAPVDDILISVERPLGIDSMGQMVASILSKKLAAGSTHLLVDIPVGPTTKVRHMQEALQLRKLFEYVGDRLNIHLEVIITDGSQPVGRGIGPVLEARDIMQVLRNEVDAPNDLKQKALRLAGRILEFDPDVRGGYGYSIARDILESGRALEKMEAIIHAQGKQKQQYQPGKLCTEICAPQQGFVTEIDNHQMSRIARLAGAPMDKGAGVDLLKKVGEPVDKDEALYRIYAEFNADFKFAGDMAQKDSGYRIGSKKDILKPYQEI